MLIESAMPITVIGIGLLITEAQGNLLSTVLSYIWGMFCIECNLSSSTQPGSTDILASNSHSPHR